MLLVDDSSATQLALPFVRDSLPKFVARLAAMEPTPHIGLWSTGDRPTKRVDVTPNVSAVLDGIKRLFTIQSAGAYLLQGVIEVTDDLRKKKAGTEGFSGTPVLVSFVAEGGVEYSTHQRSQIITALKNTGASLWSVTLQQGTQPDEHDGGPRARGRAGGRDSGQRRHEQGDPHATGDRFCVYDGGRRSSPRAIS